MSTAYKGRHTGGDNRGTPTVDKARTESHATTRTSRTESHGPTRAARTKGHILTQTLSKPLVSAAAILAVAGISAATASQASTDAGGPRFTASPMAVAQAAQLSHNRDDTNVALAAARRSGVQRASALTHAQKAAADALVATRARTSAAMVHARVAAAQGVAREHARQGLLKNAQSDPKAAGRLLAADRGWGAEQFACLDSLWNKESGWRWSANNGSSGAYGIPQALPGSKMASAGSDWRSNPITQIKWGLGYISGRYGTPCGAWAQSRASNWY